MAIQQVNIGTPGAGGGDPAHVAFKKINDNATELYNAAIPDTEEKKTQARANLGLGAAATRNVGTVAGNVMEVGAFGIGGKGLQFYNVSSIEDYYANLNGQSQIYRVDTSSPMTLEYAPSLYLATGNTHAILSIGHASHEILVSSWYEGLAAPMIRRLKTDANTSIDSNGFIKAASPIVNLFADSIELNEEAHRQDITFEKLGTGDYLVKGSTGFAQEGWYIEMPKDANGNVLVAVVYEQLENNDISVKTYAKKFDDETGDIVANLTKPRDIPAGRWIDLRLQELPQPEIQIPESIAPPDFQPTNLAQAVEEALNNGTE